MYEITDEMEEISCEVFFSEQQPNLYRIKLTDSSISAMKGD
jgi:hypothetical protein